MNPKEYDSSNLSSQTIERAQTLLQEVQQSLGIKLDQDDPLAVLTEAVALTGSQIEEGLRSQWQRFLLAIWKDLGATPKPAVLPYFVGQAPDGFCISSGEIFEQSIQEKRERFEVVTPGYSFPVVLCCAETGTLFFSGKFLSRRNGLRLSFLLSGVGIHRWPWNVLWYYGSSKVRLPTLQEMTDIKTEIARQQESGYFFRLDNAVFFSLPLPVDWLAQNDEYVLYWDKQRQVSAGTQIKIYGWANVFLLRAQRGSATLEMATDVKSYYRQDGLTLTPKTSLWGEQAAETNSEFLKRMRGQFKYWQACLSSADIEGFLRERLPQIGYVKATAGKYPGLVSIYALSQPDEDFSVFWKASRQLHREVLQSLSGKLPLGIEFSISFPRVWLVLTSEKMHGTDEKILVEIPPNLKSPEEGCHWLKTSPVWSKLLGTSRIGGTAEQKKFLEKLGKRWYKYFLNFQNNWAGDRPRVVYFRGV